MLPIDIQRHMDPADLDAVRQLLRAAESVDGHRALGEHKWLDLLRGGGEGFVGLTALSPAGDGRLAGYAQLSRGPSEWGLEVVIDPGHREAGVGVELVGRAIDVVRAEGGGHLNLWVSKPRPEHDEMAAANHLTDIRDLYQMRRPLPVGKPWQLDTRPFQPGADEAAWLTVNNRAFDWHPEQGGWDEATVKAREAEDWFDPEGFLLHEEGGRLAGFCWTKIHTDQDPPLGEIYVVAVDPDWQGTGLGRKLTLAGLDYLAGKGLKVGMLYVDATNRSALKLYVDLGFTIDHIDRAYAAEIRPT
jgi:mycothiol synthase